MIMLIFLGFAKILWENLLIFLEHPAPEEERDPYIWLLLIAEARLK